MTRQAPQAPMSNQMSNYNSQPKPAPQAPVSNYSNQPMQPNPSQMNNQNQNNPGMTFTITPQNFMSAMSTAASIANGIGTLKSKLEPPGRPAPVPAGNQTNNPPIPG